MRKQNVTRFVSTCLIAALLVGCGKKEGETASMSPILVKIMTVETNDSSADEYNYSGTIEEENATAVSFSTGGTITQLNVKVGDHVNKGQLIASVDPTTAHNSYEIARATLQQAEDAYGRMKQLHEKGSLADIKWVEVQSQLEQAVSAEKIAKKGLDDCHLYAPTSGYIADKQTEVGQNIAPGMPIVKIVTTHSIQVKVAIPEGEMANLRSGQTAEIVVPALENKHYQGKIVEKGVIADPISRSYCVKMRLEQPDEQLLPGMVAKVNIRTSNTNREIIIPANIVQLADDNTNFVWLDEAGIAVRRSIVCKNYRANGVVVSKGLQNGDRLIIEGQQKVCTGSPLKCE